LFQFEPRPARNLLSAYFSRKKMAARGTPLAATGLTGCGKTQKFSVIGGKHRSGPEGPVDFIGVMRGLKPPPPSGSSFSAAC
jgi:hypothetical protein